MEYDLLGLMPSISFDRAAGFYDETRAFPPGIADLVAASAHSTLPSQARVLECGIGTGRIAIPLARRGLKITGIDLSLKMMQRMVAGNDLNLSMPNLIQGDATRLPLASGCFDAVLMVHVLHLIPDWPAAIEEVCRVLKAQGIFLTGYNHHLEGSVDEQIREKWKEIVSQMYPEPVDSSSERFKPVKDYLTQSGAVTDEWVAARWSKPFHLGRYIESLDQKIYSSTWNIPDDLLGQCIARLRAWAEVEFGTLDYEILQSQEFIWHRFRWE
jgi:ubiquinone/menaquinone biosynthesis C-methylase UbiE